MSKAQRLLVLAAALLLLGVYLVPVWSISLEAPQYPEGLGIKVWLHTIGGQEKGDLRKINQLNHYIGMKQIKPEEMLEMKIMPAVLAALSLFGVITAFFGRRMLLRLWLGAFILFGIVGFADFFYWAYDYGHNLDPAAPLKVPGMSYQPPLIGTKKLLNFTAHSWPAAGGILAFMSFGLGALALCVGRERCAVRCRLRNLSHGALVVLLSLFGCSGGLRPINYGVDTCAHCRMLISDPRFGAELVTTTGKVLTFDAVECLAQYLDSDGSAASQVRDVYVSDYDGAPGLTPAAQARFLKSSAVKSPMGASLAAYHHRAKAEAAYEAHGGQLLSWEEVRRSFALPSAAPAGVEEAHTHHHHHEHHGS